MNNTISGFVNDVKDFFPEIYEEHWSLDGSLVGFSSLLPKLFGENVTEIR